MPDLELSDKPIMNKTENGNIIDVNSPKCDGDDISKTEDDMEEIKDEWIDVLGSGFLKMKTLVKGEPNTRPQDSDICTINLEGRLEDGTVFEKHEGLKVTCAGSEVIQGLDLVLPLMDVGQQAEVEIKPRFGYGNQGLPPNVPSNATLYYTVELVSAEMAQDLTNIEFSQRRANALLKKEKGNWWYSRGDATKAIQLYRAALEFLQDSTPYTNETTTVEMPEETFREFVEDRIILYNNLAAAQMIISAFDSALISVDNVLKFEPKNPKALFRKGKILGAIGNTQEAVDVLKIAAQLLPDNVAVRKELNATLKQLAQEKIREKALFKKMLGTDKSSDEDGDTLTESASDHSLKRNSKWTIILGVAATVVASAAIAVGMGYHKSINLPFFD